MSSCLTSRACGFDLEHMINWPCSNSSRTPSNSSSPSSTLSELSNSPVEISNQKTRKPRKRPNQTYHEAAALLSMASPNIFKTKHLTKKNTNFPKFTIQSSNFFNQSPELITLFPVTENLGILKKPCFLTDLKNTNSCQKTGETEEIESICDDFDTESILNEEIEQGIDSIMGESKPISEDYNSIDQIASDFNKIGYPMGLGFGLRNRVRALKNADERNWWNFPMVNVVNSSPATIGKCEKSPAGKKKKKTEEFRQGNVNSGGRNVNSGKLLKLDYDGVLNEWGDKELPVPEEISHANIDLFSKDGGWNESTATHPMDKDDHKKIPPVKSACSDKRSRCKGRFVKKTNSSVCDDLIDVVD